MHKHIILYKKKILRGFRAVKLLCDIIMMDIYYYTFVQPQKIYNTKGSP